MLILCDAPDRFMNYFAELAGNTTVQDEVHCTHIL